MTTTTHKTLGGYFTTNTGTHFQAVQLEGRILVGWLPNGHKDWSYWYDTCTIQEFFNRFTDGYGELVLVDVDSIAPRLRRALQDLDNTIGE